MPPKKPGIQRAPTMRRSPYGTRARGNANANANPQPAIPAPQIASGEKTGRVKPTGAKGPQPIAPKPAKTLGNKATKKTGVKDVRFVAGTKGYWPDEDRSPEPGSIPWEASSTDGYLLPYIALGFSFQRTKNEGLQCGANALSISLQAVQEMTQPAGVPVPNDRQWPGARIAALVHTQKFREKLEKQQEAWVLDDKLAGLWTNAAKETAQVEMDLLSNPNLFSIAQLEWLLDLINEEMHTNYIIGYVTQGYQVTRVKDGEEEKIGPPTCATLSTSKHQDHGPVIWIYYDNAEDIAKAEKWKKPPIPHWEGFSPAVVSSSRQRKMDNFDLYQRMRDDITSEVFLVIEDCPGDGPNELSIRQGLFVRDSIKAADNEFDIPEGYRYVETSDGKTHGIVPEVNLRQIEEDDDLMSGYEDNYEAPWKRQDLRILPPEEEQFLIFRSIADTDKLGNFVVDPELVPPDVGDDRPAPKYSPGQFFRDLEQWNGKEGKALVQAVDGAVGWAHPRTLQYLVAPPWGLKTIPTGDDSDSSSRYDNLSLRQLVGLAEHFELELDRDQRRDPEKVRAALKKLDKDEEVYVHKEALPLFRLMKDYLREESGGEVRFLVEEIVLAVTSPHRDRDPIIVRDFEGNYGRIQKADLEELVAINEKGLFGIQVYFEAFQEKLSEMLAEGRPKGAAEPAEGSKRRRDYGDDGDDDGQDNDDQKRQRTEPSPSTSGSNAGSSNAGSSNTGLSKSKPTTTSTTQSSRPRRGANPLQENVPDLSNLDKPGMRRSI